MNLLTPSMGNTRGRQRRETLKGAERNTVGVQQNPGGKGVQKHLSAATVYTRGRGWSNIRVCGETLGVCGNTDRIPISTVPERPRNICQELVAIKKLRRCHMGFLSLRHCRIVECCRDRSALNEAKHEKKLLSPWLSFFYCKSLGPLFPGFVCQNRFLPRQLSWIFFFIAWRIFLSSVPVAFSPTNKKAFHLQ